MTLSTTQHLSIDELLTTWRAHDDLKRAGASVPELYRSHERLSNARLAARTAR